MNSLRGRTAPLVIELDGHGCIRVVDFHFETPFQFGVAFPHPEGEVVIGEGEFGEDVDIDTISPRLSEYLPGFEIMDALGPAERSKLGMREGDIGAPTSGGCLAVQVRASPAELDAVLVAAELPFRVRVTGS